MVEINEKDSTIKVTKACLRDMMVVIKVICKDPALVASAKIQLKRALIEPEPQPSEPSPDGKPDEERETHKEDLVNKPTSGQGEETGSITDSYYENPDTPVKLLPL